jgi:hypothetical protein
MCDELSCLDFLKKYLCCCYHCSEEDFEVADETTPLVSTSGKRREPDKGKTQGLTLDIESIDKSERDRKPCNLESARESLDLLQKHLGPYAEILAGAKGGKSGKLDEETTTKLKRGWQHVCEALEIPLKFPGDGAREIDWFEFTCVEVINLANRQSLVKVPDCPNTTVDVTLKPDITTDTSEAAKITDHLGYSKDPDKIALLLDILRERLAGSVKTAQHVYQTLRDNPKPLCTVLDVEDIDQSCEIQISVLNADKHGRESPAKASFTSEGKEIGSVVLKSRGGAADKLVTDGCRRINDECGGISIGNKTKVKLPCYRQELTKEGWLISEFIPGTPGTTFLKDISTLNPESFENLAYFLSRKNIDAKTTQDSLQALDVFARAIGLRDLHIENFVFSGGQAFPIDLEVFNIGDDGPTELFCLLPEPLKQDEKTQKLLAIIAEDMKKTVKRFVPLATSEWGSLIGTKVSQEPVPTNKDSDKEEISLEDNEDVMPTSPYHQLRNCVEKITKKVTGAGYKIGTQQQQVLWDYLVRSLEQDKIIPFFVFNHDFVFAGSEASKEAIFAVRDK